MASIKHLVDLDLNKNQLLNAVVQNLAVAPSSPSEGQIYWNTVQDSLFVWRSSPAGWVDLGETGVVNLSYSPSATNGVVTNDSGDNATIPLTGAVNAGLFSAAQKTKLDGIEANAKDDQIASEVVSSASGNLVATNVQSALEELQGDIDTLGAETNNLTITHNTGDVDIAIENGTDITLDAATTSLAGVMTAADKSKLNGIAAGAQVNVGTTISESSTTNTTVLVTSSTGGDATLNSASTSRAGLMSKTKFDEVVANNAKVSNVSTSLSTGTVTSTTYGINSDGSNNDVIIAAATTSASGVMTGADKSKLNGIEAGADVTDATNVNAAGAVMNSDTSTAPMSFVIDEDNMASNSATKVPTQQSVKAYVDGNIAANDAMVFKGTIGTGGTLTLAAFNSLAVYDAGWAYKVITAGTYKGVVSEIGDLFIATVDRASGGVNADWTVVQANLDGAVIGPASAGNNKVAFFDGTSGKLIKDSGLTLSGSNTGDEPSASTTVQGIIEIATITETNTGTDATRAVSPDGLDGWTGSTQVTTVGTIATGTWQGTAINQAYLVGQSGTNTGDEVAATTTTQGIVELATQTEVNTGTDTTRVITPSTLRSTLGTTATLSTTLTFNDTIGNGTLTTIPVTHNIGNKFIQASVYDTSSGERVECEIELTSASVTTFKFNVAPTNNQYTVVITG